MKFYSSKIFFIETFLLLIIFIAPDCKAQQKNIDSIVRELHSAKHDTTKIDLMDQIAHAYWDDDNIAKGLDWVRQAVDLAQKTHHNHRLALSRVTTGQLLLASGHVDSAGIEF